MKKRNLEKILNLIREQMASSAIPTNHTGKEVAEFSPVMGKMQRRKKPKYLSLGPGSRKRWMKKDESK